MVNYKDWNETDDYRRWIKSIDETILVVDKWWFWGYLKNPVARRATLYNLHVLESKGRMHLFTDEMSPTARHMVAGLVKAADMVLSRYNEGDYTDDRN